MLLEDGNSTTAETASETSPGPGACASARPAADEPDSVTRLVDQPKQYKRPS